MIRRPPRSTLFPYTTLFRSRMRLDFDRHAFNDFQSIPFNADDLARVVGDQLDLMQAKVRQRSEERRVGKVCRSWLAPYQSIIKLYRLVLILLLMPTLTLLLV